MRVQSKRPITLLLAPALVPTIRWLQTPTLDHFSFGRMAASAKAAQRKLASKTKAKKTRLTVKGYRQQYTSAVVPYYKKKARLGCIHACSLCPQKDMRRSMLACLHTHIYACAHVHLCAHAHRCMHVRTCA